MNKKRASYLRLILFLLVLDVLDVAVIRAVLPVHTEPQVVVIQENPGLAEYRQQVAHDMDILTRSGCFHSSDTCLQRVATMVSHTEQGMTPETYRQYLSDGVDTLWQRRCIKHVPGCPKHAFAILHDEGR